MGTPTVTFSEYVVAAEMYSSGQPKLRRGQAYFVVLHEYHPELANRIRGGHLDPFYKEIRFAEFLGYVEDKLNATP
jgi:hypothetical protein